MKTITIGSYGRSQRRDHTVQYDQVITRMDTGSNTTRPQFCLESRGGDYSFSIYAASKAAFIRLKRIVAAGNSRITPGPDVLGIHLQGPPKGWPNEGVGFTSIRRAPESIIATASAAVADKPATRYPFRTTPGVEVIGFSPRELIKFAPYDPEDSITVQNMNVIVRFGNQNREIDVLHAVTADADLARSLAASIARNTPRRLMVNSDVTRISLVLANGTKANLGEIAAQSTAAK